MKLSSLSFSHVFFSFCLLSLLCFFSYNRDQPNILSEPPFIYTDARYKNTFQNLSTVYCATFLSCNNSVAAIKQHLMIYYSTTVVLYFQPKHLFALIQVSLEISSFRTEIHSSSVHKTVQLKFSLKSLLPFFNLAYCESKYALKKKMLCALSTPVSHLHGQVVRYAAGLCIGQAHPGFMCIQKFQKHHKVVNGGDGQ